MILHGGAITEAAARFGGRPEDWLDLSTGINPVPVDLPDLAMRVWHRLPDSGLVLSARAAARDHYRSGAALPLPVPGTQAFIQHLPKLAPAGRRVAILSPTYGEYAHCLSAAGFDVDAVRAVDAISAAHGLAVIANPNNPDGRIIARADLLALADRMAANGGLLVVDEAFGDSRPELSVAEAAASHPGLLVTRSFGKFFGLAGLRLGFVIANEQRLSIIEQALGPWAVSGPALALAIALFKRGRGEISAFLSARRTALDAVLSGAGLRIAGGTDLFALVAADNAAYLHRKLAERHILVRAFAYDPTWLRFGLPATEEEDRRLAAALA